MTPDTSVYTDLHGFTALRAQAQQDPDAALDTVAKQFESIFTQMMVKSMRDASEPLESDFLGSSQMKSYQQMYDQQLGLDLSNRGGLGLAEILVAQLGSGETTELTKTDASGLGDLSTYDRLPQAAVSVPTESNIKPERLTDDIRGNDGIAASSVIAYDADSSAKEQLEDEISEVDASQNDNAWLPQNPKEFVESLWGLAKKAGEALGFSPKVILAQAALETGWGKYMIQNSDGSNSFNLFGIKGGSQWSGSEASVSTLEYTNGVAERQTASFRSYESLADSFKDYVSFLTQSPRYEQALSASDDETFVAGLQESGYATDPKYAEKIISILNRPEFQEAETKLKNSNQVPL